MRAEKIFAVLAALVCFTAFASSRPLLHPEVREYASSGASFGISRLEVFHQDQEQCKIGASEIPGVGGCRVWNGEPVEKDGVYVAVASSPLGKMLAKEFSMDVPSKPQGYALYAKAGRVAIVGNDPLGALYGCMTFRQMAEDGKTVSATIRDWPDFLYRGNVSLGRGLWNLGNDENIEGRFEAMKYGIDELMRHKMNLVGDVFRVNKNTSEAMLEKWRDLFAYLRARGFKVKIYTTSAIWTRDVHPEGVTLENWHCVTGHRSYYDHYYCWSDDAATENAAKRFVERLERLGVGDAAVVTYHPVDGGGLDDPEEWSKRCENCRKRWKDSERWKASANQMNIWNRVLRAKYPDILFGSCVYPYWVSALKNPEEKRNPVWRQNTIDYWRQLDGAIEDKRFWFSGWIATKKHFEEFRSHVPSRPYAYGDTYPQSSGIFASFHRKLGSMWEEGMHRAQVSSTDNRARFESCLLAGEFCWNRKSPGAEAYDGVVYYDPLNDHTGPAVIMTNSLVRICRTFWGKDIGPAMVKVFSSGVLPEYISDPVKTVSYWNKLYKDVDYDPSANHGKKDKDKKEGFAFVDTPEFMLKQCIAAEQCVKALDEAMPHVDTLPKYKRKYFMHFRRHAPRWAACARIQYALRDAMRRLEKESCDDVAKYLKDAQAKCEREYRDIESAVWDKEKETHTGQTVVYSRIYWSAKHWMEQADKMIELVTAKGDSDRVPAPDFVPSAESTDKPPKTFFKTVSWSGEKTIDKPVILNQSRLVVEKGSKIVFRGEGRIYVRYGEMFADGVKFEAQGVLTNDYRIKVHGGKMVLRDCAFGECVA